ncbi:sulfotransferase domain-containing protein [Parvibaculum sp.]|uniref:sulfotransferase domain-containing protein n=1 Tax=Parvibaculum sp. TaxID=2024848 RepID=UPI003BAA11D7
MGALIWLASYPKSGNTWVRSFLHNLLRNTTEPADINALNQFCLGSSSRRWFEQVSPVPLEQLKPDALARLRPAAQARMSTASPDSIFVKSHNYLGPWFGVPLHNMQVTAGAIYILRNPLDVTLSLAGHLGMSIDGTIKFMSTDGAGTKLTARHIPEVYDTWSAHVASWTSGANPQLFVARYEDMSERPVETFGKMAGFLGLNPAADRLERAISNASFDVLSTQEREKGFKEKPAHAEAFFRKGKPGQWRELLSDEQIAKVVSAHRAQMERFGYVPDGF